MKTVGDIKKSVERHTRSPYKNPARYRLDFIKENTFNRLWTVRMTRVRVVIVSVAAMLALVALVWAVIVYTPLRHFVPGTLKGDLHAQESRPTGSREPPGQPPALCCRSRLS